jgi:hypothetical protein
MFAVNGLKSHAYAVGARSAIDISGMATLHDGLCHASRWHTMDAEATIAYDLARVMARFGLSARCGRDAVVAGQDIDQLPAGCTDGTVPRRLPLRHVTATHTSIRR